MIVVAIIGILAAIAIPAYQDYTIRAQVSEGLSLSSGAKTAVAEFYQDQGAWPSDNNEAGLSLSSEISGKYVSDVAATSTAGGGVVTVTYGMADTHDDIEGNTLTLTATDNVGSIGWICASTVLADKHVPAACR
jgi:type IV pilus assembly protein PilA